MTDQKKYYGLWLGIGLLLCLNLGTIGWIVLKTRQFKANRQQSTEFIASRLDFTPRQRETYRAIHARFLTGTQPHEDSLRLLRKNLYSQLNQVSVSDERINALVSRMERQNSQITRLRFRHWQQVRAICTPDQQARFDRFLARLTQNMARAQPGGRERWRNQLDQ